MLHVTFILSLRRIFKLILDKRFNFISKATSSLFNDFYSRLLSQVVGYFY